MDNRYEISQLLTKDQIGGVYLAEDSTLGRKVAFRNFERVVGEEILTEPNEKFAQFSGKLTALQHPNLITIYDIAFDDGEAYMVTQYSEDESLAERLEQGPLPQNQVYNMASDVLDALYAAHSSEIFHGALNTGSVRRIPKASGGHRYFVVDMGLNHLAEIIRGTEGGLIDPILIAPELQDGAGLNARSDLFMLAQLCYTALAGGHPFADKTGEECIKLYQDNALPPIRDYVPNVHQEFVDWIMLLAKGNPHERPANVQEAIQLLAPIYVPEPRPISPPAPLMPPAAAPVALNTTQTAIAATPTLNTAPANEKTSIPTETTSLPADLSETPKKNYKIPLTILTGVVLAASAGLVLYFNQTLKDQPGTTQTNKSHSEDKNSAPPLARKNDNVRIVENTPFPSGRAPIPIYTNDPLDWIIMRGKPSVVRHPKGLYISEIQKNRSFKEISLAHPLAKFRTRNKTIASNKLMSSRDRRLTGDEKAQNGDGWAVTLNIPESHTGDLTLICYIVHGRCDVIISAQSSDQTPQQFQINDYIDHSGKKTARRSRSIVTLEILKPIGGTSYTFEFTAKNKGFPMDLGLCAMQIFKK